MSVKTKIKLIAYDLDGTLLTTEKHVTDRTKEVLKKLQKIGIQLVPTTGRPITGIPEDVKNMEGITYIISANGGRIAKGDETVYEQLLSVETSKKVLDIFCEYDALIEIYYNGQGYAEREKLQNILHYMPSKAMAEYIAGTRLPIDDICEKFEQEKQPMDKMQALFFDAEERKEAWNRLLQVEGVVLTDSLGINIEVNKKGTSKAAALRWLADKLQISMDEIMSFGDANNDLLMLKESGVGVAMGNAIEEVQKSANYQTETNDSDGVAVFLEKYFEKELS